MTVRLLAALALWNGAVGLACLAKEPGGAAALQPPPKAASAVEPPAEPIVGQMEHSGWALIGPRGRHYFFGGLAVADYVAQGERHIVTLQQEEPTLLPKPDDEFLYYRELGTGDRWAIGRQPLRDDTYVIYRQPASAPVADGATSPQAAGAGTHGKWMLFHRARLRMPGRQADGLADVPPRPSACVETATGPSQWRRRSSQRD
jgi:hypothetical protein